MTLSACEVYDSKTSKFIKQHKASGLLSSLEIKTSFSKTHLLRPLLLKRFQQVNARYKIDEIVNKFLLIMHQIHLKQDGFKCIACRPVTKNKERIQIFQE